MEEVEETESDRVGVMVGTSSTSILPRNWSSKIEMKKKNEKVVKFQNLVKKDQKRTRNKLKLLIIKKIKRLKFHILKN